MKKKAYNTSRFRDIPDVYSTEKLTLSLTVPSHFKLLCVLLGVNIEQALISFMADCGELSGTSETNLRDMAVRYLICRSKSRNQLSEEDTTAMLQEFNAMQTLWPRQRDEGFDPEELELHQAWSLMYLQYWYKKWYLQSGRKDPEEALKNL